MRQLLFAILGTIAACMSANSQELTQVVRLNERVPQWTTDQAVTFGGSLALGTVIGSQVEKWTDSKLIGIVAGTLAGGLTGYLKDEWDMRNNNAIPNRYRLNNDVYAGLAGGFTGALTIRIDLFDPYRKDSKIGYGRKFNQRKFIKRRR